MDLVETSIQCQYGLSYLTSDTHLRLCSNATTVPFLRVLLPSFSQQWLKKPSNGVISESVL